MSIRSFEWLLLKTKPKWNDGMCNQWVYSRSESQHEVTICQINDEFLRVMFNPATFWPFQKSSCWRSWASANRWNGKSRKQGLLLDLIVKGSLPLHQWQERSLFFSARLCKYSQHQVAPILMSWINASGWCKSHSMWPGTVYEVMYSK